MSIQRIDGARERRIEDDEAAAPERPGKEPTASERLEDFLSSMHGSDFPMELFHNVAAKPTPICNNAGAEGLVTIDGDLDKPISLSGMTSQAERLGNLARMNQLDGDPRTKMDQQTCGVQCVVAALYVQNPSGVSRVAEMELSKNRASLDSWAKSLGMSPAKLRADLGAIASGTASPRQIATLSQVLLLDMRSRTPSMTRHPGTAAKELETLTKDILVRDSGVAAPKMRLELRGFSTGGHWEAQIDYATTADTEENARNDGTIAFDPWPAANGRAPSGTAAEPRGATKMHDGTFVEEHTVSADGSISD